MMRRHEALGPARVRSLNKSGDEHFTYGVWVTGNPIVADPAPDVTPPAASRILVVDRAAQGVVAMPGVGFVELCVIGGTSVVTRVWRFEPTTNKWWNTSSSDRTITLASTNMGTAGSTVDGIINGARIFIQIVTVNGAVTALGYRAV